MFLMHILGLMENKNVKIDNKIKRKNIILSIITGIVSGGINGLFGGGGGMIVVPMLTKCLKYKSKNAHATAILIILPLSIISGILYLSFGKFNLNIGIPVGIGVVIGGVIGAFLLKKLSSKWIVLIFSIIMAFAGGKMLFF